MGWYPGIINTTSSGGGCPDLMLMMTTDSPFDLTDEDIQTQATKIPQRMFYGNKVKNISMSNITEIGDEAFHTNSYLNNIDLSSCSKIGSRSFAYSGGNLELTQLKTINLPALELVGEEGFRGFYFKSDSSQRIDLSFPSLTEGGRNWLHGHNHTNYVGTVDLPSIRKIGYGAFVYVDMETLRVGPNCTDFGGEVFSSGHIGTIYCEAIVPPSLGNQGLGPSIMPDHIYVPSESVNSYIAASRWSDYSSVIAAIPTIIE